MTGVLPRRSARPRWLTMHRAVLGALVLLVVIALLVSALDDEFAYRPGALLLSLVLSVVGSAAVSGVCAAVVRVPPGADSWAITALILFFLMPGVTDAASGWSMVIAAGSAALSKYVLAWRRRLTVNPAVVGAIVTYALAYAGVEVAGGVVSSPVWWIAAEPLFWPMLIIGVLLVTVLREWWTVGIFVIATLATVAVLQLIEGGQDLQFVFVSAPTMFLAAIMLPEPLTSPSTRVHRAVYAIIVAVLANWQQVFEITDSYTLEFVPQIALGVGCVYAFVVRLVTQRGAGRVTFEVQIDEIAAGTHRIRALSPQPVAFRPGQWATLSAPQWSAPLWHRTRRVFSFAAAPGENPTEFAFTVGGSEVSAFKRDLIHRGGRLLLDDTGGDFVAPRHPGGYPIVLLAGGIGITPFRAMVRQFTGDTGNRDLSWLTVIHVIREQERSVFDDDLDAVRAAGGRVEVVVADDGALPADLPFTRDGAHYYISGSPEFVHATSARTRSADPAVRLRFWRLHTDSFLGY